MMQSLLAVLLVAGCSAYAAWALMPAAWRRRAAAALLRLPLPDALASRLGVVALAAPGCSSCGSCGDAVKAPSRAATQVITVHPRTRR